MKKVTILIVILCEHSLSLSAQDEHEYIPYVRNCEFGYYESMFGMRSVDLFTIG